MISALLNMLKGHGNDTLDSARLLFVLSWLTVVGLQFIALFVKEQTYDSVAFATSLTMILGVGPVGIGLKDKWRQRNENSPPSSQ